MGNKSTKIVQNIDFHKLGERLQEIERSPKKQIPIDPLRGLSGDLLAKQLSGLAGHRNGKLTIEEYEEIQRIQFEYDQVSPNVKTKR